MASVFVPSLSPVGQPASVALTFMREEIRVGVRAGASGSAFEGKRGALRPSLLRSRRQSGPPML